MIEPMIVTMLTFLLFYLYRTFSQLHFSNSISPEMMDLLPGFYCDPNVKVVKSDSMRPQGIVYPNTRISAVIAINAAARSDLSDGPILLYSLGPPALPIS